MSACTRKMLVVVSALLWSCLVGRFIAFGPTVHGWCWCPRFEADSWYRLTPIPYRLPHTAFAIVPCVLILATVPALLIPNRILHMVTVIVHASEQAFVPIFVAQVHDASWLALWSMTNAVCHIVTIYLYGRHPLGLLMSIGLLFKASLDVWLAAIECRIVQGHIVREPPEYDGRSTRAITV